MKIVTLLENTTTDEKHIAKHGLCFYIETKKHKLLVDLGPDGSFIENAKNLNINLKMVDTVIISHGHDDHGGGLKAFLDINKTAKIYVRENAFENFYVEIDEPAYIGLDKSLKNNPQFVFLHENCTLDDELYIFSGVTGREFSSTANLVLREECNNQIVPDSFSHEQYLVICENGKTVLIGGCAHNGITNILSKFKELFSTQPTHIISGFHLFNPTTKVSEKSDLVNGIAGELHKLDTTIYTCHCTGKEAYALLKEGLGEQLNYLSTGSEIVI